MLRCERCGKSVLKLDEEQAARVRENPSAYAYLCIECRMEDDEDIEHAGG